MSWAVGSRAWLAGLRPPWRAVLAMVAGAVAVLAFPPFSIVPVLIPGFVVLLWLAGDAPTARFAFARGLAFGFGHFLAGLYWIAHAFQVVGGASAVAASAVAAWPAVAGLSGVLALYPAIAAALLRLAMGRPGRPVGRTAVALFAALWTVGEWLRGWAFTGFPWNPLGSVWVVSDNMIQVTAWGGVYGLSLLTAFAAAALANDRRRRFGAPTLATAMLAAVALGGAARLADAPPPGADMVPDVRLRLVQPNIPQRLKWRSEYRADHVHNQIAMSIAQSDGPPPSHVIWAETAVPFYVNGDDALVRLLSSAVPPGGALITGGLRRAETAGGGQNYNSLFALDDAATIKATYDKAHLVPFGEYMPFGDLLPFEKLTAGRADFAAGDGLRAISLDGLPPFQPLICYEAIFPGDVVNRDGPRPAWLLNVTNDAWYGASSGPYQHLALARLRAVEEGLPLVRVANTGISAVVDSYGRSLRSLPLETSGTIDSPLPKVLKPTPFATLGNTPVVVLCVLIIALSVYRLKYLN